MRRFGLTLVLTALTAVLAACGSSATPSPSASAAAPSTVASAPAASAPAASAGGSAAGSALSCAAAPAGATAAATVTIQNFSFSPSPVNVKVGDAVTWTNKDGAPHSATMDGGACDTDTIASNGSATLVFNAPGTYTYHCKIHPGQMKDVTVVVQ